MTAFASFLFILLGPVGFLILPNHPRTNVVTQAIDRARAPLATALLPLSAEFLPQNLQTAQVINALPPELLPLRNWQIVPPEVDANAAAIIGVKSDKVFYERNLRQKLPIASLTKLATALVVMDELLLTDEILVSRHAVSTGGDFGNLAVGETLTAHDLLRAMLIASSNDAAVAFSEHLTRTKGQRLTELMNAKAYALALGNTHFISVSGLEDRDNYSTAEDMAKLLKTAMENSTLAEILKIASVDIRSADGKFVHRLITSNKLLNRFDGVVAGKTGYTSGAGGCLAILAKNSKAEDDFLVVVLGATNEETRFDAAEALINWMSEAYRW